MPIRESMIISDRCSLVTALHHKIEERLRYVRKEAFEDDELWLHGQCITHAFKPMKMALRVSHLVDDWNEFHDKYSRILSTCEKLFNIQLSPEEVKSDLDAFMSLRDVLVDNKLVDDTVVLLNKEMKN